MTIFNSEKIYADLPLYGILLKESFLRYKSVFDVVVLHAERGLLFKGNENVDADEFLKKLKEIKANEMKRVEESLKALLDSVGKLDF